jgi:hypothetical protein
MAGLATLFFMPIACLADQPKLGYGGTLIPLKGEFEAFRGYRVDSVRRGTPAARMGLERGDIVVFIGRNMAFTTHEAYLYALRQQGNTATIGIINVRNGRLVWANCRLNHDPQPHRAETPPNGLVMVDFARNM